MASATAIQRRSSLPAILLLVCATLAGAVVAAQAASVAEVATMSGPDRLARLVDGAKKEGGLQLYSSAAVADMAAIIAGFEKKYGLKVKVWKDDAADIRYRALTEFQANRFDVDDIETAGPDMEALQREHLLQRVDSPTIDDLIPQAVPPHREWMISRIAVILAAYNTNLVSKAELPASYDDLVDPRWKGKLGIEAVNSNLWLMGTAAARGERQTIDLFRRIVAINGVSLRRGHVALANFVASGEVPFALTVYRNNADQLTDAGAPLATQVLPPLLALPTGIAVARRAPHPYSAVLFWEHYLTEGQKLLAAQRNVPSNRRVKEPPPDLTFINSAQLLDEGAKWQKLFDEIFAGRAR